MIDIPCRLWVSSSLALTASFSAIALSVQRGVFHKPAEEEQHFTPIKVDQHRDPTAQFSDAGRIIRITFDTSAMVVLAVYTAFESYRTLDEDRTKEGIYIMVASVFALAYWLYCLALAIVSQWHRLPNEWGWILNIHLFLLYLVIWCISLTGIWTALTEPSSYMEGLQASLVFILSTDLLYTTATRERGPPFLDENEKRVIGVNVASIYGFLCFSWVTPLIETVSRKKEISDDDLPTLSPEFRGYNIYYIFGKFRGLTLLYRIYLANRSAIIIQLIAAVISSLLYYAPAYFVNRLLSLFQKIEMDGRSDSSLKQGILIVVGLGVSMVAAGIVAEQLWYFAASSVQLRVKAMLSIEIYRKTLRRVDQAVATGDKENTEKPYTEENPGTKGSDSPEDVSSSIGTIMNLMSVDSIRISEFCTGWFTVLSAPAELAIGIYFLYNLLGLSCFLGLLVMVVTLPLNHFNAKLLAKTQDKLMKSRDKRVSLMNEVLQGIRQIKFFAWETNWEKHVMEARNLELRHLRTTFISEALFTLLWQGSPMLVTIISFWSFTKLEGKELTAPIAFTAITVFNQLRFALNILPEMITRWLQTLVSLRRIQAYLLENEISPAPAVDSNKRVQIAFTNATVGWKPVANHPADNSLNAGGSNSQFAAHTTAKSESFMLKNLDVKFPAGKLSLICGTTGSGKTLMLLSMLGEAVLLKGDISCPRAPVTDTASSNFALPDDIPAEHWILEHGLAYVSQSPWLQNASIRDNVLFGLPFVSSRYKETLYACALDKDLAILEDGDLTEIGEKGITLSGGQKQRVALARAVYSRAETVFLDDVLSAVDAHTAKHLFKKCLMGPLMNSRTRILITHHVRLCVSEADYLVYIKDGCAEVIDLTKETQQPGQLAEIFEEAKSNAESLQGEEAPIETIIPTSDTPSSVDISAEVAAKKLPKTLVEDETRTTGKVKLRLYKLYLKKLGNVFYWLLLLTTLFGARGLYIAENWWIKEWSQSYEGTSNETFVFDVQSASQQQPLFSRLAFPVSNSSVSSSLATTSSEPKFSTYSQTTENVNYYLGVYVLITLTNVVIGATRFAVVYWGSLGASRKLYAELLHRVFRAPLRFFDKTPVGRIVNRFSKDFETIDSGVPNDLLYLMMEWITMLSSIITVSLILPIYILPLVVVAIINIFFGSSFVSASRALKRIDSVSRSPLFSHFTETIAGVSTIRAFGATRQFLQYMLKIVDASSRPFYYVWVVERWFTVRFTLLGAAINACTGIIILLSADKMDAAMAGFCLSFVLIYTVQACWTIRRYTILEMSFNAVERVVEFMEIDQEAPTITAVRPPAEWPTHGRIEVSNLEVRYAADLDPVLRDISFSVKAKEKIGIVGRTGSGKTTLSLSFFRFLEASAGSIVIDDIDIKVLGTEDLRSNLTIIPQDPTLFSGTLRSNVDPFDQFSDDEIFTALRHVQLLPSEVDVLQVQEEDANVNVFKDLKTNVSEGGKNFSQGQRQLLCLARALLKRSCVVLMDEATASVDFNTDKAIQKTITTEFAQCTILCIAHRLHTVIEYDRILVLDEGRVAEYASPLELITNTESLFYEMCRSSGEFDSLVALAKAKHQLVDV